MKFLCSLLLTISLAACTVMPTSTADQACELLEIAFTESNNLAPGWYISTGEILEACKVPDAKALAKEKACEANKWNGYACTE